MFIYTPSDSDYSNNNNRKIYQYNDNAQLRRAGGQNLARVEVEVIKKHRTNFLNRSVTNKNMKECVMPIRI